MWFQSRGAFESLPFSLFLWHGWIAWGTLRATLTLGSAACPLPSLRVGIGSPGLGWVVLWSIWVLQGQGMNGYSCNSITSSALTIAIFFVLLVLSGCSNSYGFFFPSPFVPLLQKNTLLIISSLTDFHCTALLSVPYFLQIWMQHLLSWSMIFSLLFSAATEAMTCTEIFW